MDPFHERLARLALARAEAFGFALAGGYAVQAHGFLDRPSEDVDLFTTIASETLFPEAVKVVVEAYQDAGLSVATLLSNAGFARLAVTDPDTGATFKVELGIDWRQHPPTVLNIGPVLHPDDAVASKVGAIYSRGQARDYIDVDAVLRSGRYTSEDLVRLATEHDPGIEPRRLAMAVRAMARLPVQEFTAYGLSPDEVAALRRRMDSWAETIDDR